MLMREQWKSIRGHPNYEVSSYGRVRSVPHWRPHNRYSGVRMWWKGKILKPGKQVSGHLFVVLNGQQAFRVHRLVARAFIGPPPFMGAIVRHRDGNPSNNQKTNVVWGTQKNNMDDARRHGRIPRGRARPNTKLYPKNIPSIRASTDTLVNIARKYGVAPATIRDVRNGTSWGHV